MERLACQGNSDSEWGKTSSRNLNVVQPLDSRISGGRQHPKHSTFHTQASISAQLQHKTHKQMKTCQHYPFPQRTSNTIKKLVLKKKENLHKSGLYQCLSISTAIALILVLVMPGWLQQSPKRRNYLQALANIAYSTPHFEILMYLLITLLLPAPPSQSLLLSQKPSVEGLHCLLNKIQAEIRGLTHHFSLMSY